VLPAVLDSPFTPLSSVLICLGLVFFVAGRYWGLLVRLQAIEAALDDLHRRLLSRKRSEASLARWNGEADDDQRIQAALNAATPVKPAGREPWWRKHRGI
jgi:hypothetical protein